MRYTFEDKLDVINREINKRRNKWRMDSIRWMDFDDVAQILRRHISIKWEQWDQSRKLEHWISRVCTNQIHNLLRNHYTNYARPCIQCKENIGDDQCRITPSHQQCEECPLYAKWVNEKKVGYDIKMPLELEHHTQEVFDRVDESIDFGGCVEKIKEVLREKVDGQKFKAFCWLYIDKKDDSEVAEMMGYKTHLKNKSAYKKQIKELREELLGDVKEIIRNYDILD